MFFFLKQIEENRQGARTLVWTVFSADSGSGKRTHQESVRVSSGLGPKRPLNSRIGKRAYLDSLAWEPCAVGVVVSVRGLTERLLKWLAGTRSC